MFGRRRRREAAAAEEASAAERRDLFAHLAQRPPHICPFLGLAYERTAYVEGASIEHRCYAFGDPAPLSSEQQTRVCQERGYGHCPRYLRGLLVTPTEELQALRNPKAATLPLPPLPSAAPPAAPRRRRRRRVLILIGLLLLLLLAAGGGYLLLSRGEPSVLPTASPSPSASAAASKPSASAEPSATTEPSPTPTSSASESALMSPTPEPTPIAGDTFAFYEVSVGPGSFLLFEVDASGDVDGQRRESFDDFSFARVEPLEGTDDEVYWLTVDGDLSGLGYRYPDSGDFRIRAVFVADDGTRRSAFLETQELTSVPEATPAP